MAGSNCNTRAAMAPANSASEVSVSAAIPRRSRNPADVATEREAIDPKRAETAVILDRCGQLDEIHEPSRRFTSSTTRLDWVMAAISIFKAAVLQRIAP